MHSGNIGHAQNLETLVRATTFLRDLDDVRVVLIGGGARYTDLVRLADAAATPTGCARCPTRAAMCCSLSLSSAHLHFVGLAEGLAGFVVPSRLYGIMAAGRPVVVAADPESETAQVVERVGCGIVIPPSRPELLAEVIRDAYEGRYDLDAMGARGRAVRDGGCGHPRRCSAATAKLLREYGGLMRKVFWGSLAALAWTHVGYPAAAAVAARIAPKPVRREDILPTVTIIVAAHNEEDVIARRIENLLELDYPTEVRGDRRRLRRVHGSHPRDRPRRSPRASTRVSLLECPRGGKVAAQNLAVARSEADVVAFSDANATWAPDALRKLVRAFADPEVAYCCGRLVLEDADGTNVEGAYWRMETWLREQESETGSITGGNGSIYAVRRSDYVDVDTRFGHDLSFPYLMVQRGPARGVRPRGACLREADARRRGRVPPQGADVRARLAHAPQGPDAGAPAAGYLVKLVSHRHLRYGSGVLHLALLGVELPARAARGDLPAGVARSSRVPRRGRAPAGDGALLHARHVGHRRVAQELRRARRAGRVGQGAGDEGARN